MDMHYVEGENVWKPLQVAFLFYFIWLEFENTSLALELVTNLGLYQIP